MHDRQHHKNESLTGELSQAVWKTPYSCQYFNEKFLSKSLFFPAEIDSKMNKPEKQ